MMNVLVACEESQRVCCAFRSKGHRAFSCDLLEASGNHPEWHIKGDVLSLLNGKCEFVTADGKKHVQASKWDMIIAFPPCTYLTCAGERWFSLKNHGQAAKKRLEKRQEAVRFFIQIAKADCERIAIENPQGYMNTHYRAPDQVIQPFYFGDAERKRTCLWLKGLPQLIPTNILDDPIKSYPTYTNCHGHTIHIGFVLRGADPKSRSKTFPGIARAMAEQWGSEIINTKEPYQLSLF